MAPETAGGAERPEVNVLVGGEAGQGLVTVGRLLAKSLVRSGYHILVTQDYQSRIRGGHNTFGVRAGVAPVRAPAEGVDLLVALDGATVALHRPELRPGGLVVADAAAGVQVEPGLEVPFAELAPAQAANVAALGVAAAVLGLDLEVVAGAVSDLFGAKHPEAAEANRRALAAAHAWAVERGAAGAVRLAPPEPAPDRLMLNGNEAIAYGALSAGLRFLAFYPMTPSTSVALTVAAHARDLGVMVEQAEDEIAAVNMAIGASFAGAPAMVTTSGGGFALMEEGVSLAAMTETPLVVVVAQRPGPATGLPTRTEQGDLDLVLHAGHGEFPRAILAPGTVEECFELTHKAFHLAELAQGPVFVLTDQFLADSDRAVAPFDLAALRPVEPGAGVMPPGGSYRRYEVTENGVSPRLLPGLTPALVVADSDEHTPDGHITEDLGVRVRMVDKRLRKAGLLRAETVPPEYQGPEDPDLLLVAWGSTGGAAVEAAEALTAGGRPAAVLRFRQVWPLVPEQFSDRCRRAREVICVEGNATGQFERLLRCEAGVRVSRSVRRYDGRPVTPGYILRALGA
ncbi:2-oxoacid:acceptor oxidoreductase subunit alpha [Dissulfurirhabdus thermomarina]|uniref:2-oxoacid:acceptor oxidoreductase subunit alpha n=1 Tax=Dissulfurirhabdus thermomarina TaxID=1765737 RepID=A0A6N9TS77_DISTH|nr:2-oxoacid:acceptor oxidoreductase subunit alpha [Dissulfurirhabdus thermomarina]NDY42297.1 2-oxoacid:acceptor oxidoreductase subunit alpha [Dissulfurirhabdus thermomarina]NMX24156.1 2-oxoacid:acceptor oxidoreductase subunit alpha [Dissulfurirhabdus thermomarina]